MKWGPKWSMFGANANKYNESFRGEGGGVT